MTAPDAAGRGYPIVLRLGGRRVLVVGGGQVAGRRASGLLAAGAHVVAVSPVFAPAFMRLRPTDALTCVHRPYQSGDLTEMSLVVAATDDPSVNARVSADARRAGVWVNIVDDPAHSDFIVPAVVRRGGFLLAMSSGGASPALVGQLRRELDRLLPEDVGLLVAILATARERIQRRVTDPARRRELATRLLTVDLLGTLRTEGRDAVLRQIEALTAPGDRRRGPRGASPSSDQTTDRQARGRRQRRAARTRASPRTGSRRTGRDWTS
jgi:precorrin-2 dehydrogenase/sirohydrochlorin ferrochelatase